LRLSGVIEHAEENIDSVVTDIFNQIGSDVTLKEVDNMHRLNRSTRNSPSKKSTLPPRDIIIKFTTYRARQNVLSLRKSLSKGVFLNEELSKQRSEVFFYARRLKKDGHILGTWTSNGKIVVKDHEEKIHKCDSIHDLARFKPDP
jgi:hypothetical protein